MNQNTPNNPRRRSNSQWLATVLTEDYLKREYIDRQRTQKDIAANFGVCAQVVGNYLRRFNIKARTRNEVGRRYAEPVNLEGFAGPNSDEHAYWLGFIAADGCVYTNYQQRTWNMVRIKLHINDKQHLETLQQWLQTPVEVRELIDGSRHSAFLEMHSSAFVKALAKWGIVQCKSLSLPFPKMSQAYIKAFIRGYFDGDGTIYWRQRKYGMEPTCRFISGSMAFLSGLESCLHGYDINTLKIYRHQNSNAFILPLSNARTNLCKFATLLYPKNCVALARKRNAFQPLFEEEQI